MHWAHAMLLARFGNRGGDLVLKESEGVPQELPYMRI
jgi:hypothetical protein